MKAKALPPALGSVKINPMDLIFHRRNLPFLLSMALVALQATGSPALAQGAPAAGPELRLSPRVRVQLQPEPALPALAPHRIEPFLADPLVVDEATLRQAPRIVAAPEGRVLITRGDLAYARGAAGSVLDAPAGTLLRIVRDAREIRDPVTQAVLGLEAQAVGRARLQQAQGTTPPGGPTGTAVPVPAVLEIVSAREEILAGDRLLPEPARPFVHYLPHPAQITLEGARIAAMPGDAVGMAGQNQIVVINKGLADGLASGQLLRVLLGGPPATDRTSGLPERMQLPDEHNGLLMVFRPFERLSYALILETRDGVKVGDRVVPAQ
ncbi:MAG: hypothetical protein RL522_521 [Pseudomonadota bacterium]|jgi:hypothetical protein